MGALEAEEEKSKTRPTLNEARILSGQARSPKAINVALNLLLDKYKYKNSLTCTRLTILFMPNAHVYAPCCPKPDSQTYLCVLKHILLILKFLKRDMR